MQKVFIDSEVPSNESKVNNSFNAGTFAAIMKYAIRVLFLLLFAKGLNAQTTFTVSGTVKDSANGEIVSGCTVSVPGTSYSASTNSYGFYSLSLPKGENLLVFSYATFKNKRVRINLEANMQIDVELQKNIEIFRGVKVSTKKLDNQVEQVEMSSNQLKITQIKKIPALLGEVDIVKTIQLLPGVSTVGEGATGFNVRGGSIDQNLILLDEAPVFNASHLFGFFSVFNPDAVKDVKLIKGGIPSEYGGRLSSTLDVRMKDGNSKKFQVNGGVGVIFSRLSVEGPIARKNPKL